MEAFKELVILIAEDDEGHSELILEGLREAGICNSIIQFANGEQVWQFLSGKEAVSKHNEKMRYLLLLDINMPKMNGMELLSRIKSDVKLKEIPVVMLTTTDDPQEVEECYRIGCNFYITKPVDFIRFTDTLKQLGLFIQIVTV